MAQDPAVVLKKLAERVLAKNGDVPLAQLLELLVPVRRLRELARDLGLTPKGGFRVDKAPAHVLAPLLAEVRQPEPLDRVLRGLVPAAGEDDDGDDESAAGVDAAVLAEQRQLLSLRESELARSRDELERAREALARAQEREREQARRAERLEQQLGDLRRDRSARAEPVREAPTRGDKELQRRVHDLENEREGFVAADAALRRQAAFDQSRLRELEQTVRELEDLLPKGKRRKKPPPAEPPPERRFLLPRFTAAFYKSLDGKEPRAVERAIQAVLLFCTEGHGYPGLEVKQLGGQDTWSLRASLGLRVYFRQGDGEIELLELGDREDQNTTLRRLKER